MINFGSTKQKSESSSVPIDKSAWTAEQQTVARQLFDPEEGIIARGLRSGPAVYPRSLIVGEKGFNAPRSPEEQAYFASVKSGLPDYVQAVLSGKPSYDINPEITEQYYQDVIRNPAIREYKEIAHPALLESFAGPGFYGSRRAEEESRQAANLATTLSAARANLYYQDEMARRTALESAANRVASTAVPAYMTYSNLQANAGQLSRSIEQDKVLADFSRWMAGEPVDGVMPIQNNPFIRMALEGLSLMPQYSAQKSSSTSSGTGFSFGLSLSNLFSGGNGQKTG